MANRTGAGIVLVALGLALAACGDDGPAASPVTGPSPIAEPGTGGGPIRGRVYDTALRPLGGALVEALDGPQAGTTTNADASGEFSFPGTFDNATRFQASMEGHVAGIATVHPTATARWIKFYLALPEPSANMAGELHPDHHCRRGVYRTSQPKFEPAPTAPSSHPVRGSQPPTSTFFWPERHS